MKKLYYCRTGAADYVAQVNDEANLYCLYLCDGKIFPHAGFEDYETKSEKILNDLEKCFGNLSGAEQYFDFREDLEAALHQMTVLAELEIK